MQVRSGNQTLTKGMGNHRGEFPPEVCRGAKPLCRGLGVSARTPWNPPLAKGDLGDCYKEVQDASCQESEGVPRFHFFLSPKSGGPRGLIRPNLGILSDEGG